MLELSDIQSSQEELQDYYAQVGAQGRVRCELPRTNFHQA
jgi:hypothetical protein